MEITSQLLVNSTTIASQATKLEGVIDGIGAQIKNAQSALEQSSSYWRGPAAELYRKDFAAKKEEIETLMTRLRQYPKDIRDIVQVYDMVESGNVERSENLPVPELI